MFALCSTKVHNTRRRIIAPSYSKSAICSPKVQSIIRSRASKVLDFLKKEANVNPDQESGPLLVRNVTRAMGVDIFTAFAFSEEDGTTYLDKLASGPNTMEQLGMSDMRLWCEDTRESFFFFESEPEFKRWSRFLAPHGRSAHRRFESFISNIVGQFDTRAISSVKDEKGACIKNAPFSPYARLHNWKDPVMGTRLSPSERASEIMDHMGKSTLPSPMSST